VGGPLEVEAGPGVTVIGPAGGGLGRRKGVSGAVPAPRLVPTAMYELLPGERAANVAYALKHPEIRHRVLAWRMQDVDVCATSVATVYRVLQEANLICCWKPPV